eukprot:gene4611-5760_t
MTPSPSPKINSGSIIQNYSTGVFYNWGEKYTSKPTFNNTIPNVSYIINGFSHSLAMTEEGHVYGWGDNRSHQLGVSSDIKDVVIPVPIQPLIFKQSKVKTIACGGCFSAAILENGFLYTWGVLNEGAKHTEVPTKVDLLKGVTNVAIGLNHVAVIADTNTPEKKAVYTWGTNKKGQLGVVGDSITNAPRKVTLGAKALFISCGDEFTSAIVEGNEVFVWGNNKGRQICNNTDDIIWIPVKPFLGRDIVELSSSRNFIAARSGAGNVLVWGNNEYVCRAGDSDKWITFPNKIRQIAAGLNHVLALSEKNEIYSWGHGEDGQLGHEEKKNTLQSKKINYLEGRNVLSVYAWGRCSGALVEPGNFRVEVSETLRRPENLGSPAPLFVRKLVNFIRGDNTKLEGIFRLSGSKARCDELERKLDTNEPFSITKYEPYDAADILKRYFKSLPEPIFMSALCTKYEKEILNNNSNDQKKALIFEWLSKLPKENRGLVIYLLSFLDEISYCQLKHQKGNAMAAKNLALVFAPNLLTKGEIGNDDIIEMMINMLDEIIAKYSDTEPLLIIDQAKDCLRGSRIAYTIEHWTRIMETRETAKSAFYNPEVLTAIIKSIVDGTLESKGSPRTSPTQSPNNSHSPTNSPISRFGGSSLSLNAKSTSPVLYGSFSSPSLSLAYYSSSGSSPNLMEQSKLYEQVLSLVLSPVIPIRNIIKVLPSISEIDVNEIFIKLLLSNKLVRSVPENISELISTETKNMKEIENLNLFKDNIKSINLKVENIISDVIYINKSIEYWKNAQTSIQLYSNQIQSYFKWWGDLLQKSFNETEEKVLRWKKDLDKLESEKTKIEKLLNTVQSQSPNSESDKLKNTYDQWCFNNQLTVLAEKIEYNTAQMNKFILDKATMQVNVEQFKPHLTLVEEFTSTLNSTVKSYIDTLTEQSTLSTNLFPQFFTQYIDLIFNFNHQVKSEPSIIKEICDSLVTLSNHLNSSNYYISLELETKFNSLKTVCTKS